MEDIPGTCKKDSNSCAKGYFCPDPALEQDLQEMACVKCNENCLTCSGNSEVSWKCESCESERYLSYNSYCRNCHSDCPSCTGPEQDCGGCKDGLYDPSGVCEVCPGNSSQKIDCVCGTSKNCLDCNSLDMKKCGTCQEGYDINSSTPCEDCLPGYGSIAIKGENICVKCDMTCKECSGTETTCTACNDGFILSESTCTKCLAEKNQICPCGNSPNCTTCNDTDTNECATCKSHYDNTVNPPCSACESKYFEEAITDEKECTLCKNSCDTCLNANTCLTCQNGNYLENEQCQLCSVGQKIACTCGNAKHCGTCDEKKPTTCLTCMHGFASTKEGVCDTCGEGFFKNGSDDNFTCEPCLTTNCAQCPVRKDRCTKCVYNMYLNFRTQCQQCLKGDRILCHCGNVVNCATCSTDKLQTCGDCMSGYEIDKSGSCTICALDFVQIGDKCVRCRANYCEKCSADALKCEKCRNNFAPNHVGCEACSLDGPECVCQAAVHCAVCSADGDKCKSCVAGYQIDDKETCTNCAINYVKIGEKCVKCQVDNCDTCSTDAQTCVKCKNNFVPNGNKCDACRDNGPECLCGTAVNCATCAPNADKCKSCVGNFDPKATTPCTDCLDGFFKSDVSGKSTCTACSDKCTNCTSAVTCTACQDGFSVDGNKCVTCEDANCNICSANKNVCTKCNTGYLTVDGKCELKCYQGQSVCAANQICLTTCKTCSENCMTCEVTVTSCTSCAPGFTLDRSSCAACSAGCADCTGNKNVCNLCKDGYFGISGVCQSCQNNSTAQCECSGAANCATCNNAKSGTCGTCIAGYKMSASNTCAECADGYLMVDRVCTKCEKSCKICYESIEKCSICADSYTMSIKQTCEKDCTPVLTNGKACVGGKAVECDDDYDQITACKCGAAANCQECNERNMSTCESCMPGYKLIGGSCTQCAVGATTVGLFCFDPSIGSQNFLSGGAIAGIVIAVLVVIGLVAGGAFWYVKRSKHTPAEIGLVDRRLQ
ncbi:Cysteine-rich membrane protein 2 [Spironucleus salmonicida]|uniref:Cysteine-rich membrane protein 2 n=1 Tax=Spironucleus salmonicida TaxID=348837 RepID=V6LX18_9EUKA|nr:Cysteine-rich membrane protein 2 [Spironucleus salmonicida]|eukprot:EST45359.1 Cysteine-rich membrane protein 2 [Spironucleus salmonicida]